ncbi:hypothetical protein KJ695_01585 [Patescibacteria group bacterium]|nr:hypothetical protein [Patescibacteria group bacterium]MBU4056583.1 hypothetical protein [Patescibacteria group bacterium]MBU4368377.1 hypothetical protein [Patescibacteria group bacterium]
MNNLKASQAIQVTQELNKNNREREVGGLIEVMQKYKIEQGLVLVQDLKKETEEKVDNKKIKFVSLWKRLLEE